MGTVNEDDEGARVWALDPGNNHAGVAVLDPCRRAPRGRVTAPPYVRSATSRAPTSAEPGGLDYALNLLPALDGGARRVHLVVEVPPFQVRADVRHGSQAEIGYRLGVVSGAWAAAATWKCEVANVPVSSTWVPVADWRKTMMSIGPAWGARFDRAPPSEAVRQLGAPPVRWSVDRSHAAEDDATVMVRASPCGHSMICSRESLAHLPATCDQCEGDANRHADQRSKDVTDRWKRRAVSSALSIWPHVVEPLRDAARARARTAKPDHQLVGVPDACEAIWLGAHAALTLAR